MPRPHRVMLTTADVAWALKIPEGTTRRWVHEGRLTRHGTERRALYDAAEVSALADLLGYKRRPQPQPPCEDDPDLI